MKWVFIASFTEFQLPALKIPRKCIGKFFVLIIFIFYRTPYFSQIYEKYTSSELKIILVRLPMSASVLPFYTRISLVMPCENAFPWRKLIHFLQRPNAVLYDYSTCTNRVPFLLQVKSLPSSLSLSLIRKG